MNDFPQPRFVSANGIRLAVHEQGSGVPVVFSHGFPELAYSWRHQLPALAAAGFRAIAPDQRGYGASDRPEAVEAYDIAQLTGDLVSLLDSLGIDKAVFCGHDWGGMVIWTLGQLHPSRVLGLIGVNTPFMARSPMPPLQMLSQMMGPEHYITTSFTSRSAATPTRGS
jgi:pimeloyl-ACP methyl ester carboxylesterase